ncbi:type I-E CRISPR-associated protein Cas6/Cse3/CasE [Nocardia sp. SYP-A9097]|uniref:type I-E CRISPR-associated protein Cas6/Cse3/CasE n=1 Tax=Nocardia sp. SYP-A9097 TaxID=2663237 RepID=UPI00129ADBD6|nr:type I-E CRISPR-associated protein Cas6/Cse3/CasE [Nocardia sp. SYP-A9097]MRH93034.1 type I-E CRISPR-associated protein Cas6/Cse3/CasE [Nocardia sp. SYP-A9097]
MYLSRIPLNPARRGTRAFLSSPQTTHAAVMASFPPGLLDHADSPGRVLWRIDQHDKQIHLYVVSPAEPDFTHIIEQAGWPTTGAWATRKYGQLLDTLTVGQRWHFRLTANPVRHTQTSPEATARKVRGRVTPLKAPEQLDWLRRRAADAGFCLAECGPAGQREDDVRIIARESLSFRRQSATVSLSIATFEGTLVVTDTDRLTIALTHGIGRAKGYGCGLLTLAPPQ